MKSYGGSVDFELEMKFSCVMVQVMMDRAMGAPGVPRGALGPWGPGAWGPGFGWPGPWGGTRLIGILDMGILGSVKIFT